jgi:hypothetical protein
MRSWWPIPAYELDDKRLLGEHLELHTMNSVILNNKKGYSKHPETLRWVGHTKAMKRRHDEIESEMKRRGMKPKSPMKFIESDADTNPGFWESLEIMKEKLKLKQASKV